MELWAVVFSFWGAPIDDLEWLLMYSWKGKLGSPARGKIWSTVAPHIMSIT
jgi:hypothetical protein